jgi:diadenosine tetraphosphatase ApaH/serine/threonine PP2A family protein phosphatase
MWALLSDVHGNLAALERALAYADAAGASRVAFLGDALGGLPGDEACCRLLMERADLAVFGNREVRVRFTVPDDVRDWLRALPATARAGDLLLCHSSPASLFPSGITAGEAVAFRRGLSYFDLFPYVSGRAAVERAAATLSRSGMLGVAHGHTHRRGYWRVDGGRAEPLRGTDEAVLGAGALVVGLGSVGEGERGRIEFALYAPEARRVQLVSLDPS